eukprot:CAMPEP_0201689042 /NCGR_PEP_ID=MMETSP0578-20130828/2711_1 /ASSEMBLY_ACC=CAM_ASM_000663 /TAXON_ID=267565 /ORGANISM="Skeletonema grethea, Strain CCMP 1804" /LENGTH=351 /DNA_ID=CAMNT_0048173557 /DNA_START=88 /DNA_END=1140 /DNA_ORIENTATION=-
MDMDMIDSERSKCSSSLAAHNTVYTNGPRRGKVFLPPPPADKQHVLAENPPPPSSSNDCRVDDEASALSVENYANLFFGSDDDDDNSLTLNSSIQSLAMSKHHHCWEPESHLNLPTSSSSSSSTRAASIVPLLPPTTDRRKRRRVSFTTSTPTIHTLHTVPPSSTMTPAEKSTSWLQSTDIESLKSSALSTIQTVRKRISSNAREYKHRHKFRALMVTIENETDSSIRGLEHKVYRRKETRRMLIQDVMDCQHYISGLERFGHVMSMEEKRRLLANASLQKSRVCVKRALLDARDDYKEVYSNNHHHGQHQYHGCIPSPLRPEALKIRRVSSGAVTDDDGIAKSKSSIQSM